MSSLTSITKDSILQVIAAQEVRIKKLEGLLQGQPIDKVRIARAAITDAKIESVSADKITTGSLQVTVAILIKNNDGTGNSTLIGYQLDGF